MTKEKQIEEMQKDIMENTAVYDSDVAQDVAETLIYAGYRKASDVTREIFEEIEKHLRKNIGDTVYEYYISGDLAELKKKYTEEGK